MDNQAVDLGRELPDIDADVADIDRAAGRVLQDVGQFAGHAALKVGGRRIDRERNEEQDETYADDGGCTCDDAENVMPGAGGGWRLDILALFGIFELFAHGATSPGFMMRTVPWAFRDVSQSFSRLPTRCCRSISWMRSETVS